MNRGTVCNISCYDLFLLYQIILLLFFVVVCLNKCLKFYTKIPKGQEEFKLEMTKNVQKYV